MAGFDKSKMDPTLQNLRPQRDSDPRIDATHAFVPRVFHHLSYEATPNGVRTLHSRINDYTPKLRNYPIHHGELLVVFIGTS